MTIDEKLAALEKGTKALEAEKSFEKSFETFKDLSVLVQELIQEVQDKKGKITEITKGVNGYVENPFD